MKNEPIIGEQKSSQPGQSFFFLFNFFSLPVLNENPLSRPGPISTAQKNI